eukprot:TRINITY_DN7685_c0_g1_i3.p1 TRINITY_DN7685_c0_g1~~TRINITY_DN7685_c0_g1_i3.p1  ORF type:complete len:114 (+),score=8.62 TRINITY_DN7685_c0_g1_i3:269-610(+)
MKVVDMFGCQLPVCAINYTALPELVKDNINGLIFKTPSQLAEQIYGLFSSFPCTSELDSMRSNIREEHKVRWHDSWKVTTKGLFVKFTPVPLLFRVAALLVFLYLVVRLVGVF